MQREMKLTLNDGMLFQIVALLNWLERAINTPYFSALDFSNPSVWNIEFDEVDFFSVWNQLYIFPISNEINLK